MFKNAVLKFRNDSLAQATKSFRARGYRLIRCQKCLLAAAYCICNSYVSLNIRSRFCLLMYDTEVLKPSNTGRLIADILPDTLAFLWSRTYVDPSFLQLLESGIYQPYTVSPEAYADKEEVVTEQTFQEKENKPALFILLDGTWPEARKMFRKSPYLTPFPVLSLTEMEYSSYQLREAANLRQLCTVEVAIQLLNITQEFTAQKYLLSHFQKFTQAYLASKPNRLYTSV